MGKFNSEGSGYDHKTAEEVGMEPDETGHYGSVVPTTEGKRKKHKLPKGSHLVLKGKKHETFHKTVKGENKRGSVVEKHGNRYYSIPKVTKEYAYGGRVAKRSAENS